MVHTLFEFMWFLVFVTREWGRIMGVFWVADFFKACFSFQIIFYIKYQILISGIIKIL